jgi:hypothetical protein
MRRIPALAVIGASTLVLIGAGVAAAQFADAGTDHQPSCPSGYTYQKVQIEGYKLYSCAKKGDYHPPAQATKTVTVTATPPRVTVTVPAGTQTQTVTQTVTKTVGPATVTVRCNPAPAPCP